MKNTLFNILKTLFLAFSLVFVSCEEETPLTISISSPEHNSKVEHFLAVPVVIETGPANTISYYVDNHHVYSIKGEAFNYEWLTTNFSVGEHTLTVKLEDESGRTAEECLSVTIVPSSKLETGVVNDVDGNAYNTVKIGEQWWMAENLRTTKYQDGTKLNTKTSNWLWSTLEDGAYCWYKNDSVGYAKVYGALYNWYAVETGNLCPVGWHVPSDEEWKELELTVGISPDAVADVYYRGTVEALALKAPCNWSWLNIDVEKANTTGFSAINTGWRFDSEDGFANDEAIWWTSTDIDPGNPDRLPYVRSVNNRDNTIYRDYSLPGSGYSVRCVKN